MDLKGSAAGTFFFFMPGRTKQPRKMSKEIRYPVDERASGQVPQPFMVTRCFVSVK